MKKILLLTIVLFMSCSKTPDDLPISSYSNIEAIVTFLVNMSYQINSGNFDPSSQYMDIAGSFNDWDGIDHRLLESGNNIYELSMTNLAVGEIIEFKFRINGEIWENPNPDISECVIDSEGFINRVYTIEAGENILEYWFDDMIGN